MHQKPRFAFACPRFEGATKNALVCLETSSPLNVRLKRLPPKKKCRGAGADLSIPSAGYRASKALAEKKAWELSKESGAESGEFGESTQFPVDESTKKQRRPLRAIDFPRERKPLLRSICKLEMEACAGC